MQNSLLPTTPTRPRFYLLDGLRLVAALAVMGYHYTALTHQHWGAQTAEAFPGLSQFTAYGSLGVQLFFLISGFVILMSTQGRTVGQFVASRVSRLYPAYWFAVLSVAVLTWFIAPDTFSRPAPQDVLANMTMMQSAVGVDNIDGVYWTLWVELLFYLLIGALMAFRPKERAIVAFVFLWPLIGAVAQNNKAPFLQEVLQPNYAPLFAGGMMLYLIFAKGHSLFRWTLLLYTLCLACAQTVNHWLEHTVEKNTGLDMSQFGGTAAVVLIYAVVALVTVSPLKYRGPKWLSYAGALTYPVYLIHEKWGWWVISWASDVMNKWMALGLAVTFSLVAAALIERFVERPLRPILTKAVKQAFESMRASGRGRSTGTRVRVDEPTSAGEPRP